MKNICTNEKKSVSLHSQFENMYIAIAGNIGAGKTTLTKMFAKYYGW